MTTKDPALATSLQMDEAFERWHELKCDPGPFDLIVRGVKQFEVRNNDRDYRVGDGLVLRETENTGVEMAAGKPLEYTGRVARCRLTNVMPGGYGIEPGYAVLGIELTGGGGDL